MDTNILKEQQKLDSIFENVKDIKEIEMQSHFSKYLCILVCGFIENSIKSILNNFVKKRSQPIIANYFEKKFEDETNFKYNKIRDLLASFDKNLGDILEKEILPEQKDAINSILTNRHDIAHGRYSGLTFSRIRNYFQHVKTAIYIIDCDIVNH
jgi:hypothetical protein